MTLLFFPQACGVSQQVRKLLRGSLQTWLCFGLDDCHLPPVSAPLSSHGRDSLPGPWHRSQKPCPHGTRWLRRKQDSVLTSLCALQSVGTWKGLCFYLVPPQSHSMPLLYLTPCSPASTACSVEEGEREGAEPLWLPCRSQAARGSQTRLSGTDGPSHSVSGQTILEARRGISK